MGAATDAEVLARAVRVPGRLVLGPTSTTSAFPHGGVSLGLITECELEWDVRFQETRDPASGAVVEVARRTVESPRIACLVDNAWDEDLLIYTFAKTTQAASLSYASPPETRIDGTVTPSVVSAWCPILFSANDPQHKSVYFRRPIPRLSLRESTRLSMAYRAGLPLVFIATPDLNNATTPYFQVSRLENMTL